MAARGLQDARQTVQTVSGLSDGRVVGPAADVENFPLIRWAMASDSFISVSKSSGNFSAASDRKSTRLNSSHVSISYAVFCLKKKINPFRAHERQRSYKIARR